MSSYARRPLFLATMAVLVNLGSFAPATAADAPPADKVGPKNAGLTSAPQRWAADGPGGVPEFSRHVVPLLGKLGCNGRACHGSFQGQNGFRLSLFGHDAKFDHTELTADTDRVRVDLKNVDKSLALRKPSGRDDHEGGELFSVGSWEHRLLRDWIAGGAKFEASKETKLVKLDISPREMQLHKTALPTSQLRLVAEFSDGSREDVTPLTLFSTNNDAVAKVSDSGLISLAGPGDTAIVATYAGVVVTSQVLVQYPTTDKRFPEFASDNPLDALAVAKWKKVGIHPSGLSSDAEFLRRVYLDLIGTLPTADEARQFLGDKTENKRARLIDELLERPEYAMYWATKFSDWTGNDSRFTPQPRSKTAWLWYDWLRDKLARNLPYDEIVGGFLTATSREVRSAEEYAKEYQQIAAKFADGFDDGTYARRKTNDMYWMKAGNKGPTLALQAAYAFLGIRLECAQCHKHPFDRWTQDDFQKFAVFFNVTEGGVQKDLKTAAGDIKTDKNGYQLREVYVASAKKKTTARLLGGDDVAIEGNEDPRQKLFEWLRSPENPLLARAIANRLWGHYFGVGIVHPVDDFNAANPPSNPQLLDWLTQDFIEHKFDLKHLHRTILTSRTYQLTWQPNDTNRLDERNFSHALLRRMPAEVVIDAINQVTGTQDAYNNGNAPAGTRTIGLAPSRLRGDGPEYALTIFGRPLRTQTCDCERSGETGLSQALYLLNDVDLNRKIADEKGRLAKQLAEMSDNRELIEELYLGALSRYPSKQEMKSSLAFVAGAKDRAAGMQDVLWSLLNLREFIFVH